MIKLYHYLTVGISVALLSCSGGAKELNDSSLVSVKDAAGRTVMVKPNIQKIICSGAGCLRLAVYLNASDMVVAVDDMEQKRQLFEARPYALAHPEFKKRPIFGQFRGNDNPELISALEKQPDLIFKTHGGMGMSPENLQLKTNIPVIVLNYGDLTKKRDDLYQALRIMGSLIGKKERADSVVAFFENHFNELQERVGNNDISKRKKCYVAGVAFKGIRGVKSTAFEYPPFVFTGTPSVTDDANNKISGHADVSAEQILEWDPEIIFIDISSIKGGRGINALAELKNNIIYKDLKAVKSKEIYGLLPYNFYYTNFGSVLADCYFVGKTLYPDNFSDINPEEMADSIYKFLTGSPVYKDLNVAFDELAFKKIDLDKIK